MPVSIGMPKAGLPDTWFVFAFVVDAEGTPVKVKRGPINGFKSALETMGGIDAALKICVQTQTFVESARANMLLEKMETDKIVNFAGGREELQTFIKRQEAPVILSTEI
jgi:hypothetical protein